MPAFIEKLYLKRFGKTHPAARICRARINFVSIGRQLYDPVGEGLTDQCGEVRHSNLLRAWACVHHSPTISGRPSAVGILLSLAPLPNQGFPVWLILESALQPPKVVVVPKLAAEIERLRRTAGLEVADLLISRR